MAKYRMEDGAVVDTERASASWPEATDWDGRNHISRPTGSQWEHQHLYRSSKGRYYIEEWSDWQGSRPGAYWVSDEDAARWLLANDHQLPEDLRKYEAEVVE
jgi:hypothetical protein